LYLCSALQSIAFVIAWRHFAAQGHSPSPATSARQVGS